MGRGQVFWVVAGKCVANFVFYTRKAYVLCVASSLPTSVSCHSCRGASFSSAVGFVSPWPSALLICFVIFFMPMLIFRLLVGNLITETLLGS